MIETLVLIVLLFSLGAAFSNEALFMTLTFQNYQIYLSVFTFVGLILTFMWLLSLLLLPFRLIKRFSFWRKKAKENQKQAFLGTVLEALVNHTKEQYPLLVKQTHTHFTQQEGLYWVILALLQPSEEIYQKLLSFPSTMLGGIYGFLNLAEDTGNIVEMRGLLESLPEKEKKVLWVRRAYLQLALMENDWQEALLSLENLKKTMPKSEYIRQKACCLLLAGEVDEAYKLDEEQAPIVLAKAKENPEKTLKILSKAWTKVPCQEIYQAYKKALAGKTDKEKMKAVLKLAKSNRGNRFSILALADMNLETGNILKAKEILDEYLESFPLTQQVALMMARIERDGWHHEDIAKEWDRKALSLHEKSGWICTHCGHVYGKWESVCSTCHMFNTLIPD